MQCWLQTVVSSRWNYNFKCSSYNKKRRLLECILYHINMSDTVPILIFKPSQLGFLLSHLSIHSWKTKCADVWICGKRLNFLCLMLTRQVDKLLPLYFYYAIVYFRPTVCQRLLKPLRLLPLSVLSFLHLWSHSSWCSTNWHLRGKLAHKRRGRRSYCSCFCWYICISDLRCCQNYRHDNRTGSRKQAVFHSISVEQRDNPQKTPSIHCTLAF